MRGGTGRLPGRDVKRDLALHVDISYMSHSVYMEIIWPERFSSRPGKAGQFLSQKHSVQLCRDDIMLTLHMYSASHINSLSEA